MTLEIHAAANIFPMMSECEFAHFKQDIKKHGQKEWIALYQGKILDGRNRYKACIELGIEPELCEVDESKPNFDPIAYVLSHNLHRRHLTESQRSMVAGKLATLPRGGDRGNQHTGGKGSIDTLPTIDDAASLLSVGRASVARAKQVIEHGSKAVVDAVELSIHTNL